MLTDSSWARSGILHGFLDRRECEPAPDWRAVMRGLGLDLPLVRARQVHGAAVLPSDAVEPASEADGVFVTRPGIAVGVITADCVPVLLRDRRHRAVAAVHAGWRGAAAGVLEAALDAMRRAAGVEPADIEAVVGPAVGGCCYEVGPEVRIAFLERAGDTVAAAFTPRGGRFLLDLRAAVRALAAAAGVGATTELGPCTMCCADYASYRRDGAAAGRQLSFIALA